MQTITQRRTLQRRLAAVKHDQLGEALHPHTFYLERCMMALLAALLALALWAVLA